MTAPLASLTAALRDTVADLEGYIGRRAAELAAPLIAAAEKRTEEKEAEVRHEVERREYLGAEFRRCLDAKERQIAHWREVATGKASDLILRCDEVREGDLLLESGSLMTVLKASAWTDHDTHLVGFSVQAEDGRRWHVDYQPDQLTAVRRSAAKSSSEGDER